MIYLRIRIYIIKFKTQSLTFHGSATAYIMPAQVDLTAHSTSGANYVWRLPPAPCLDAPGAVNTDQLAGTHLTDLALVYSDTVPMHAVTDWIPPGKHVPGGVRDRLPTQTGEMPRGTHSICHTGTYTRTCPTTRAPRPCTAPASPTWTAWWTSHLGRLFSNRHGSTTSRLMRSNSPTCSARAASAPFTRRRGAGKLYVTE